MFLICAGICIFLLLQDWNSGDTAQVPKVVKAGVILLSQKNLQPICPAINA
jgi:hypothetical protein